jgi:hypothetical protein
MTIIKPMKEGPLVAQVTPNLKDPVGKMSNQKSRPLACAAADSPKTTLL